MKIINLISDMQKESLEARRTNKTIGFVPTMGFLHEGHATLIERARKENDIVILSIFVNPLQFGPNEDFDAYPRDIERDERIARELGVDYLFYPTIEEMYKEDRTTLITVQKRVDVLCGKKRPGHFDGVATVVMKLFQIVMPDFAYFGMKDAQQVAVIEGLISDYHLTVNLVRVNTIREEDGLAKSSRNVYLSPLERSIAPAIYQALKMGKQRLEQGDSISQTKELVESYITEKTGSEIDYVEIYSYPGLKEIQKPEDGESLILAVAAKFSKARLIDNIVFSYTKGEN
ncbi:pantoate--beta-alanine ligase [Bacillus tianshenii]|uniref:pantoate--beta-alanine ligase n=1 Tax=Sutcliffiella tianshenii TaxID=1463404 RepID=UPI001CD3095E|nr:pantoate--beta-alanine ligase [Bacillus tianshenii]MCA1320715.1 pantoate--beta-alanine ligase [Bacillus tianshenii]